MDRGAASTPSFRFATPREARIHRRLLLLGEGPASFYLDACRMRADRTLSTTSHLVGHCFREIEGSIRDVLLPTGYSVPKEHKKETHRAQVETILRSYEFADDDPVSIAWRDLATPNTDLSPHRHAHRNALAAPRAIDEPAQQNFVEVVESILDAILKRYERRFLKSLSLIDELLAKHPPSRADAQALRTRVPNNPVTLARFFSKAEDPAWLELLAQEGFFRRPPDPVVDEVTQASRLPPWPESSYLIRMARVPELQERVVELALAVPETANAYVVQDLVETAQALPPHLGARFVSKIDEWLSAPYPSLVPVKLGELAAQLALGGETEAALVIARSLLLPVADPRALVDSSEERPRSPEPKARFEHWAYRNILTNTVPALIDAIGSRAFELLCEALEGAVQLSQAHAEQQPRDYSYIWRPAIEENDQNQGHNGDVRNLLVTAVRDVAERTAQGGPQSVRSLLENLVRHEWNVFRRVELHVLRIAAQVPRDLIVQRLTDRSLFDDSDMWHEYSLLANAKFSELLPEEQAIVLGWIEQGPDLEAYAAWQERKTGTGPTEDELAEHTKQWQIRHLARVAEVLPPNWRERHSQLITESQRLEHPDFLAYLGTWWGPTSPLSAEDLGRMSVEEIVAYFKGWQPERGFAASSPEGLGRTLSAAVAADPARFAQEARFFCDLEPTYVRGFLFGLREAARAKRAFAWGPPLDLGHWVVEQGPDSATVASAAAGDRDPGWGWTRKEIAALLETGFAEGPLEIPIDYRERVWSILRPLTRDPEPTPAYEQQYSSANMGPSELSINTTRGTAMHAIIRYGLWVKRHVNSEFEQGSPRRGLDAMPELREVLDQHLNITVDPSPTIRSVYGRWVPMLFGLDAEWVRLQRSQVFPPQEELFEAAWDGYIRRNWASSPLLPLLADEYLRAIELLGSRPESPPLTAARNLAEHLMAFYLRGELQLDAPHLTRFFAHAPPSIRAHALDYVGRIAHNEKDLGEEFLARMTALWESRRARALDNPTAHREELQTFGWWFASGRFDKEWTLERLVEVLRAVGVAEPDDLVLAKLEERAEDAPLQVADCVLLLIEGAAEPWTIFSWRAEIRAILGRVLASSNSDARTRAQNIINILAARGHVEFADLLE